MEKIVSCIILLIAAVFLIPGCFADESTNVSMNTTEKIVEVAESPVADVTEVANETEAIAADTLVANYTADVNVTNLTVKNDETILISLKENPTTGYLWNVTNSSGLAIVNDTYQMDNAKEGMVGVGGVHAWIVKAVETGNQTFTAVMTHVAEKPNGSEETYKLDVIVE